MLEFLGNSILEFFIFILLNVLFFGGVWLVAKVHTCICPEWEKASSALKIFVVIIDIAIVCVLLNIVEHLGLEYFAERMG